MLIFHNVKVAQHCQTVYFIFVFIYTSFYILKDLLQAYATDVYMSIVALKPMRGSVSSKRAKVLTFVAFFCYFTCCLNDIVYFKRGFMMIELALVRGFASFK